MAGVSATDDLNQTVNGDTLSVSLNDDEMVGTGDIDTFTNLQLLISNAEGGDNITLKHNYQYDYDFSANGIYIDKELTINGDGHFIDALGQSSIFIVESQKVTLTNITLKNANGVFGSAIYFEDSVHDSSISCEFVDNYAFVGGAVYFAGSVWNTTLSGRFINNSAMDGGAVYFADDVLDSSVSGEFRENNASSTGGGAVYVNGGAFNTAFSGVYEGNTANAGWGGALLFFGTVSDLNVMGRFKKNNASTSGGALFFESDAYNCNISGEFADNFATYGGAVCFNQISSDSDISGEFTANHAYKYGGAILFNNFADSCISGKFISNDADITGGALYFEYVSDSTVSGEYEYNSAIYGGAISFVFEVFDSNISGKYANNNASIDGGAIYFYNSTYNCDISGEFAANSASHYGGAICFSGVYNSTVSGEYRDNHVSLFGGGICFANVLIDSSVCGTYINNSAENNGGGVYFYIVQNTNVSGEFYANYAEHFGGAILFEELSDSRLSGKYASNRADYSGSAVYFWTSISGCDLSGEFEANTAGECGAALFFSCDISDSRISGDYEDNYVEKAGGAIFFQYGVYDCTISGKYINNSAKVNGEAIYFNGTVSNSNLINSVILDSIFPIDVNLGFSNCWFGNDANNYLTNQYSNCKSWLFLNGTTSVDIIAVGLNSTVVFNLNNLYDSAKNVTTHPDISALPEVTFDLSAINGYLDKYSAAPDESIVFTSNTTGDAFIKASLDDAAYLVKITYFNLEAPNVSKYYMGSENFVVIITDGSKKPLSNVHVSVNMGGRTSSGSSDRNGKFTIPINLNPGNYTATTTAEGLVVSSNVTVYSTIESGDVNGSYGNTIFNARLFDFSGNPVSNMDARLNVNGSSVIAKTDSNGVLSVNIDLSTGDYIIKTTNPRTGETKSNNVLISKSSSNISLNESQNQKTVTLTTLLNSDNATGNVVFVVNNKYYNATVKNGVATVSIYDLPAGSYVARAVYGGDINYAPSAGNISFDVESSGFIITAPDVVKYFKGPERFVVTLTDSDKNPISNASVSISINGNDYTRVTDSSGVASMAVNLNSGVYPVIVSYNSSEVKSTVTIKSTVSGENVTKIFRNGTQYYATFVDTSGKTLAENTAVEFNINGVFYTRYTNDRGVARMNINLNPGEYVITAKNPNSTEQYTNVITVLPSIVENYDLTKYYRNASQYSLRLLDDKGNPVGAGVDIRLNINGVFYTRTSNATGYVRMNINLEPGEYTITAEYNGLMASNTIKVLSVIETKNLVMKYKDGSKFEAKILDGQGNPYSGQKVTFNINGVFYEKVTDENGIARLTINLMAGEYIITSTYNGLNAANKVTISS